MLMLSLVPLTFACRSAADDAASCGGLEPRNPDEIVLCSDLGEPVLARVALPEVEPPPEGWPGIVLLHGSSGLFRPGEDGDPCSEELHGRFAEWADLLTDRGYAVIMPASFFSRGYCDWDEVSPHEDDELERLVTRAYDAAAAAWWLCFNRRVDCGRIATLGFSNGASVAMLVMHEDLRDAEDPRLQALAVPRFAAGVAYYPGCGLNDQLASRLDDELRDRFFFPTGPMWIPHAGEDYLVKRCKELRDPQVKQIAIDRKIKTDMFQLEIYAGAKHGFDVWDEWDSKQNLHARDNAQIRTLSKLHKWLRPTKPQQ